MRLLIVRFPDGNREFRYPDRELNEGDVLWHMGERYRILAISFDEGGPATATVELDSDDLGDLLKSERGGVVLDELVPT